jgi:hypothetical protein
VILVLMILLPCGLVGLLVYAAMSRWEITPPPSPSPGYASARNLPRLGLRETVVDWPVPQFQRLHPGVLVALSVVAAVWIIACIVVLFIGLSMLHA